MVLSEADVAGEESQLHYGVFESSAQLGADTQEGMDDGAALVGSAIAMPLTNDGEVRLRQVVVDESHRGLGVGRLLMAGIERDLSERGYQRVTLWARPEAAAFYEKCGYHPTGAVKELIGREHAEYAKRLI
jgi:GNAT superfamily N-acetyltransferase